ncbi:unnamed protein product [marine sediment metagenome]|uniref:Uncharacterized protein n=1 Tax=marine sediment metagenome TaxID=412755 RepID=X1P185_9ZZZZ
MMLRLKRVKNNEIQDNTPLGTRGYYVRLDTFDGFYTRTHRNYRFYSVVCVLAGMHKMGK